MIKKDILLKIAKKILNISPICSNSSVILLSAIGCDRLAISLYEIVNTNSLIIGMTHIPIIIIIPTSPIAFFKIIPHPITVSTASPNILPTTGTAVLTIAFAVLEVIPIHTT